MSKSNTNADLANLKTNGVLTPVAGWDNVPVIDTDGLGGAGGPMNAPQQALLNRTEYLHTKMLGEVNIFNYLSDAQKADALSGNPTLDHSAAVQSALNTAVSEGKNWYLSLEQHTV